MKRPTINTTGLFRLALLAILFCLSASTLAKYDDGARYAFSISHSEQSIQVIDLHKQELVEQIALNRAPDSISASEQLKALIVAHRAEKRLTLMDLSSNELTQIDYPLDIQPDYVAVSPLGETLAVYDRQRQILEIHAVKRKTLLLRAEQINSKDSFTFNLDGSKIFWTDLETGELKAIDLWSATSSVRIARNGSGLSALTRSTDGLLGFVSDSARSVVIVVDLQNLNVLKEISVGSGASRPWGTSDGQLMLVPNAVDGTLSAISTATLDVLYTKPAVVDPVSINPGWLDTIAAVVSKTGEVVFIQIATGNILKSHNLGSSANAGVVTSDSKTLALSSPATISFFDMRSSSLHGSINGLPMDISATALAVSNNLCH